MIIGLILTVVVAIILLYVIATGITLAVWNFVFVPVFHITPIEWWQALLIYLFIGLIAGAFSAAKSSR